ncbi:sulfatase-like hydrolase/transferase [Halobacterium sp. R2-5]|uniref:sulfatase-like hydrolase/transferase n=1 Tax=Halobacterium sp. R2-5 TaxID=2715751 RepID=UPI0014240987|nr:sulfatase-like hydrolase/transferase [Halobacterium sp. R2-5]NIB99457.1 sulfatase-like hydrolase/transferase [Halobacterium sp. R2-5]
MTEKQNIVLVSWDSVRADHLPLYGYDRETTPTLSAMAEDGLVFDDPQVPAVGTPASFTGMFSGKHASGSMEYPNPQHWREANADRKLLQEYLQNEGYYTGGFHFNALVSSSFGWDRGWDVYEDHMWDEDDSTDSGWKKRIYEALQKVDMANFAVDLKRTAAGKKPPHWEKMWDDIAEFVEDAPEPFFLWVLLIDTHHPYYPPPEYQEWDQPGIRSTYALNYAMRRYRGLVGERRPSIVNAYDNTIRYADAFVDQLREKLAVEGYGDEPLIVHSDHGDEFGEHANYGHRPLMYDTVTRVPMVMENVGETGRVHGPTSLLNLGSTILDLAGSEERPGGRPSLLFDERADRDTVTVQNVMEAGERMAAAVGEEWKVLYHPEGDWGAKNFPEESWEAYYRPNDPMELENRWGEHPVELEEALMEQLRAELEAVGSGDDNLDENTEERLRELGYIE